MGFLLFLRLYNATLRAGHRPIRFANYPLLRSSCLWLMGASPIPKCQYSLTQINLLQSALAFCCCAKLFLTHSRQTAVRYALTIRRGSAPICWLLSRSWLFRHIDAIAARPASERSAETAFLSGRSEVDRNAKPWTQAKASPESCHSNEDRRMQLLVVTEAFP